MEIGSNGDTLCLSIESVMQYLAVLLLILQLTVHTNWSCLPDKKQNNESKINLSFQGHRLID